MNEKKQDVVKSNAFINSYLTGSLSVISHRLIYACLLQIRSKTEIFDHTKSFIIKGSELADITGRNSKDGYKSLMRAAKNLEGAGFRTKYLPDGGLLYPDSPDDFDWFAIVHRVRYRKGKGEVQINFAPDVIPYISQLKGNYTKMLKHNLIPMKSRYGMRLYELCISWLGTEREFSIDEFRKLFDVENKYKALKDLKARVLKPALEDIHKYTDLRIKFGQVKSGRRVVAFQFAITKRMIREPGLNVQQFSNAYPRLTYGKSKLEVIEIMKAQEKREDQKEIFSLTDLN